MLSLRKFREQWGLPNEFSIEYFEPKTWTVGQLDASGKTLQQIRSRVVECVPNRLPPDQLLSQPEKLSKTFYAHLRQANDEIGLTSEQLDFAVDGLENFLWDVVYELIRLSHLGGATTSQIETAFDFNALYQKWLHSSNEIFAKPYIYEHQGKQLVINMMANVYGRMGMQIKIEEEIYEVADFSLGCPAANYMGELSCELAQALCMALVQHLDS